jgi:hypothetical protein
MSGPLFFWSRGYERPPNMSSDSAPLPPATRLGLLENTLSRERKR